MAGENFSKIKKFETLNQLLDYVEDEFPDKVAVSWKDHKITYKDLGTDVAKARKLFTEKNIKKGSHVAMVFNNNYNFVKTFFAITTLGAIAVILPASLSNEAMLAMFKKFEVSHVVYGKESKDKVETIQKELSDFIYISSEIFSNLSEELSSTSNIKSSDSAVIMLTGGTTGSTKGALLSHKSLLIGAYNGSLVEGQVFYNTYMVVIPFYHVFGLVRNLLTSMNTGSNIYLLENTMSLFDEIRVVKPNIMVLVPALVDLILATVSQYGVEALGGNLEYIICGGAHVTPSTITNLLKYNIKCCPGYGLTETANLVSGSINYLDKPDSVGIVYPGQEVKIVDGEILVKGDNLFDCYYNDDKETKKVFTHDGFLKTGDLGKFDDEGFLYITGRSKNIIVLNNGENISPEVIENELDNVPLINSSLVYEGKSSNGRSIIVAKVFPDYNYIRKLGIENIDTAIRNEVNKINERFPKIMNIEKVFILKDDFKRSASMKIIREANID